MAVGNELEGAVVECTGLEYDVWIYIRGSERRFYSPRSAGGWS